ncbi:MAG TPA: hypothetical protein VFS44_02415 [Gemmatimonadaceae bacterium]|nr:hypothetical protein [Gemmatimonadaceae bacterium]
MRRAARLALAAPIVLWLAVVLETHGWPWPRPSLRRLARSAAPVVAVLAIAAALVASIGVARRYRAARGAGRDAWDALGDALDGPAAARAARAGLLLLRAWRALGARIAGRVPRGELVFPYHRRASSRAAAATIVAVPLAGVALALALAAPSPLTVATAVVLVLLALTVAGVWASLVVHPHVIEDRALVLRCGVRAAARVPLEEIVEVLPESRRSPARSASGIRVSHNGGAVAIALRGRTDLTLRLRSGVSVRGVLARTPPVLTLRAAADDPSALIEALRARAGAAAGEECTGSSDDAAEAMRGR